MEIRIGRWVLQQNSGGSGDEVPGNLVEINQNNNMEASDIMPVKELEAQLRRIEAESVEKDAVVKKLEKELEEMKTSKQKIQEEILSRDSEITMQKGLRNHSMAKSEVDLIPAPIRIYAESNTNWGNNHGTGDAKFHSSTQQGVSDAVKLISDIKSGSAKLSARTELLEKNILIYQSHQTFKQLEEDYFSLISGYDLMESVKARRDSGFSNYSPEPEELQRPMDLLLRNQLEELKEDNFELRRRVEEVAEHISYIQKELTGTYQDSGPDISRLADFINGLFVQLDKEAQSTEKRMISAKVESSPKSHSKCISKYTTSASSKVPITDGSPGSKMAIIDEIIRLQTDQIRRYESYVSRLHQEIRDWLSVHGSQRHQTSKTLDSSNDSVIDLLRQKIEEDTQRLESYNNTEVITNTIKELTARCFESENIEMELRQENTLLRGIINDLNKLYANRN